MNLNGLIVTLAFFCESIFGFGGGLISIPLLGTLGTVKNSVLYVLIFQLLMGVIAYKNLKYADWNMLRRLGLGIIIGVILGSINLVIASEVTLRRILGTAVFLILIKSLFFPKLTIKTGSRLVETFVGIMGGYLQGVIGSGGPVFTMYLISTDASKQVFRSTLMIIFFLTSIYRFIFALISQSTFINLIVSVIPVVPFFILITLLGNKFAGRIPDVYFRYFIHLLHFLTSLNLLLRS